MRKANFQKTFVTISFMVLFIAACSSNSVTPTHQDKTDEPVADMANPAAVYCEGLGFAMENVERNGG